MKNFILDKLKNIIYALGVGRVLYIFSGIKLTQIEESDWNYLVLGVAR